MQFLHSPSNTGCDKNPRSKPLSWKKIHNRRERTIADRSRCYQWGIGSPFFRQLEPSKNRTQNKTNIGNHARVKPSRHTHPDRSSEEKSISTRQEGSSTILTNTDATSLEASPTEPRLYRHRTIKQSMVKMRQRAVKSPEASDRERRPECWHSEDWKVASRL